MAWINTGRIVSARAIVANAHVLRYGAKVEFVRNPMSDIRSTLVIQMTISSGAFGSSPKPALAWAALVNFCPESFRQRGEDSQLLMVTRYESYRLALHSAVRNARLRRDWRRLTTAAHAKAARVWARWKLLLSRCVTVNVAVGLAGHCAVSGVAVTGNGRGLAATAHAQTARVWARSFSVFGKPMPLDKSYGLPLDVTVFLGCFLGKRSRLTAAAFTEFYRRFVRGMIGHVKRSSLAFDHATGMFPHPPWFFIGVNT